MPSSPWTESSCEVYNSTFQMSHSLQQPPNRLPHWQLQIEISQASSSLTTVLQTHSLQNKISPFDFIAASRLCLSRAFAWWKCDVCYFIPPLSGQTQLCSECVKSECPIKHQEPWCWSQEDVIAQLNPVIIGRICFTDSACYRYQLLLFSEWKQ